MPLLGPPDSPAAAGEDGDPHGPLRECWKKRLDGGGAGAGGRAGGGGGGGAGAAAGHTADEAITAGSGSAASPVAGRIAVSRHDTAADLQPAAVADDTQCDGSGLERPLREAQTAEPAEQALEPAGASPIPPTTGLELLAKEWMSCSRRIFLRIPSAGAVAGVDQQVHAERLKAPLANRQFSLELVVAPRPKSLGRHRMGYSAKLSQPELAGRQLAFDAERGIAEQRLVCFRVRLPPVL